jgi:hypothetical protein
MSKLTSVIDTGSLQRSSSGTIAGVVYAQAGELCFLERNWNDLVVSVVIEWLDVASKLALGASWKEHFHFLDGPFAIELSLAEGRIIQAILIERQLAGDVVVGEFQSDLDALLSNAYSIADSLVAECDRRGWTNPTLESLSAERRQLSRVRQPPT